MPPRQKSAAARPFRAFLGALSLALASACLPYTVGSTAQTVPPNEVRRAAVLYVMPDAVDLVGDSVSGSMPGSDVEVRWGLTERTDIGVRVPSFSGVVLTAKHRLRGRAADDAAALAIMPGLGFVNWGEHAHFELSLLASGATRHQLTPYGGLRVMQVAPLSRNAMRDSPTAGGFLGLRIGDAELGVSPEVGVFYDRSALGLRDRRVIVVPAVTMHGDAILRLFRR